jgi:hypothetical protein
LLQLQRDTQKRRAFNDISIDKLIPYNIITRLPEKFDINLAGVVGARKKKYKKERETESELRRVRGEMRNGNNGEGEEKRFY